MNLVQHIAQMPQVQAAVAHFSDRLPDVVDLAIRIQQIPAPTFSEARRAAFIEERFREVGLVDVQQDELCNVFGRYPGRQQGAPVIVSAHSDTVFAEDTDLQVERKDGCVYGAGIADNSLGVASLVYLARTLRKRRLRAARDLWFVANVGEEGLGDLRGMRAVVDRFGETAGYIVLEGGLYGYVCHEAIGVRRFRIEVTGPGGHSWGAFGNPSAVHILGQLITAIDKMEVPSSPKSTFNVGLVGGGSAINAIARSAYLMLDLRSEDPVTLQGMVARVRKLVQVAGKRDGVQVHMTTIGDRPAGALDRKTPLVQLAVSALQQVGCRQIEYTPGSTDANVPISRGFPAVCVGLTRAGNTHRPDEYMVLEPIPSGLAQALLLLLAAANS